MSQTVPLHSSLGDRAKLHFKKEEKKSNHLSFHHRKLEKQQIKSKVSRRKALMKIRTEINDIGNRNSIEKISKTQSWCIEKTNKTTELLAKLTKKGGEKKNC